MRSCKKLKKSLHNLETIRLLETIGLSNAPISAKQIIKGMKKYYPDSSGRYVYEQINRLIPKTDEIGGTLLFRIGDEFKEDQCRSTVRKLKATFPHNLQFKEVKKVDSRLQNDSKTRVIDLFDHLDNRINIEIQKQEKKVSITAPFSNGQNQIPLMVKQKEGKLNVYAIRIKDKENRRFLIVHFSDTLSRKLKRARTWMEFEKIRDKAQNNKGYWLYTLDIRGLLLYSSSDEVSVKKIESMIVHLSRKYTQVQIRPTAMSTDNDVNLEFLFLRQYDKWKRVLPRLFTADIIKSISLYLKDRLDTITINDLEYMVTSQVYDAITDHIFSIYNPRLEEFNTADIKSILGYIARISTYLNSYDLNKVEKRDFMKNDSQQRLNSLEK